MITALSLAIALYASNLEQNTGATPPPAETANPKKEKKICRRPETSGTRLVTRICKTQAEWTALSQQDNGLDGGSDVAKTR